MVIERGPVEIVLTLRCATHSKDWKVRRSVRATLVDTAVLPMLALEPVSDSMMREARHSPRTCACASPLFDD